MDNYGIKHFHIETFLFIDFIPKMLQDSIYDTLKEKNLYPKIKC